MRTIDARALTGLLFFLCWTLLSCGRTGLDAARGPEFTTQPHESPALEGEAYVYLASCSAGVGEIVFSVGEEDTCGGKITDAGARYAAYHFTASEQRGGTMCKAHVACRDTQQRVSQSFFVQVREHNDAPFVQSAQERVVVPTGQQGEVSWSVRDKDLPEQQVSLALEEHDCPFEPILTGDTLRWRCGLVASECTVGVVARDDGDPPASARGGVAIECSGDGGPLVLSLTRPFTGQSVECSLSEQVEMQTNERFAFTWSVNGELAHEGRYLPGDAYAEGDTLTCHAWRSGVAGVGESFEVQTRARRIRIVRNITSTGLEDISAIHPFKDRVLVAADEELWISDGTEEGTIPVRALNRDEPVAHAREMTSMNGRVFFWVAPKSEVWTIVETEERVAARPLISAGSIGRNELVRYQVFGEKLLLWANGAESSTSELLSYDVETGKVESIVDTSFDEQSPSFVAHGHYFFIVRDWQRRRELWATDGTSEGTAYLQEPTQSIIVNKWDNIVLAEDAVYFMASSPGSSVKRLWRTQGRQRNTTYVPLEPEESLNGLLSTAQGAVALVGTPQGDRLELHRVGREPVEIFSGPYRISRTIGARSLASLKSSPPPHPAPRRSGAQTGPWRGPGI